MDTADKIVRFRLCMCSDKSATEMLNAQYSWSITRYFEEKVYNPGPRKLHVRMYPTSEDIGNGLSQGVVVKALNDLNVFDFEYDPEFQDTLYIYDQVKNREVPRRKFIYSGFLFNTDKKWAQGRIINNSRRSEGIYQGYLLFL